MTILVVERVPIYRYGLVAFLKQRLPDSTILESETLKSFAGDDCRHETVDLIVARADSAVGSEDRNDVLAAREFYPASKIVVFAGTVEYEVVTANLNAGVSGYFCEEGELEEFVKCIRRVAEGKKYISPSILWILLDLEDPKKISKTTRPLALTAHEHQIAEYFCEGKRTKWIANQLCRKVSTISTIKANIFRKLKVENVFQLKLKLQMQEVVSPGQQGQVVEGIARGIGQW